MRMPRIPKKGLLLTFSKVLQQPSLLFCGLPLMGPLGDNILPGRSSLVMHCRSSPDVTHRGSVTAGRRRRRVAVVMSAAACKRQDHSSCQKDQCNNSQDLFHNLSLLINCYRLLRPFLCRLTGRWVKSMVSAFFFLVKTVEFIYSLRNSPS